MAGMPTPSSAKGFHGWLVNAPCTSSVNCCDGPYVLAETEKNGPNDTDAFTELRSSDHPHLVPTTPGSVAVP